MLVLGHTSCGAITSAIKGVELGNITSMLQNIAPAVAASQDFPGEKAAGNNEFVAYVLKNNVIHAINMIREKSPILKQMEDSGHIKIAGAYYDMQTGRVTFL